jgi:CheY-like chemotaxis protein
VLIDDDEVDVEAVARLLRQQRAPYMLTTFGNGQEAQAALEGSFGGELQEKRCLFLLDLNMPRMNGLEFLDWLRQAQGWERAIVFAFTTSDALEDRQDAYARHVAGYLAKSQLGSGYRSLLALFETFDQQVAFPWLGRGM